MARKSGGKRGSQTKGQKKEQIERKRVERSYRNAVKKDKQTKEYRSDDDSNFTSFDNQLRLQGLRIKDVAGDGNCLFRSFADQIIGDDKLHGKHRQDVIKYMKEHRENFEPFLEESVTFDKYIQNLSTAGTYGGNDSIVAFARYNKVDVIIHQFNSPTFVINGNEDDTSSERATIKIHLAYHNYEHYSSVRHISDPDTGPAHLYHKDFLDIIEMQNKTVDNAVINEQVLTKRQRKKANKQMVTSDKIESTDLIDKPSESINLDCTRGMCDEMDEIITHLKNTSGFKNEETIKTLLLEHNYNEDLVLSYLMKLLLLQEDEKEINESEVTCEGIYFELNSKCTPSLVNTDSNSLNNIEYIEKITPTCSEKIFCECQINNGGVLDTTMQCNGISSLNDLVLTETGIVKKQSSCFSSLKNPVLTETCTVKNDILKKDDESLHNNSCKTTEKSNSLLEKSESNLQKSHKKSISHKQMSNRQRKEQVKRDKKKNREEVKRKEFIKENIPDEVIKSNIKCINI